jgi:DNA-binding transcriptional regulator GbsR (MarR family)
MSQDFQNVRRRFITQWGALGSQWGINRTMAMIHALLLVAERELSTDEVMEELNISRGNANTNLRDLIDWGLVQRMVRPGERREYFAAEKDVWKIFCMVARERKRRETEPAQKVLEACIRDTEMDDSPQAREFRRELTALSDFVSLANTVMEKVAAAEQSRVLPRILKVL